MSDTLIRWTVRGISPDTLDMLSIVRENSEEGNYGDYINEAISKWFESLPEAISDEEDNVAA